MLSCPYGKYCAAGSSAIGLCDAGWTCPDSSQRLVCPTGYVCVGYVGGVYQAPASCENPNVVYYCPAGSSVLLPCPVGYACNTTTSAQCPAGTYCKEGSRLGGSYTCQAGTYCPDGRSQTACVRGQYCPAGASASAACPVRFYCANASVI
jgi:hypothetical protein